MARFQFTTPTDDPNAAALASDEAKLQRALDSVKAAEAEAERQETHRKQYKPERPERPKAAPTVTVLTLSENNEKDGYELRFPGPISEAWSNLFHEWRDPEHPDDPRYQWRFTRWSYHGRRKTDRTYDPRWYAKRSEATRKFAKAAVKVSHGVDNTLIESGADNQTVMVKQ